MPKIKIEGSAEIGINSIICVCGFCGNHENTNAVIELNFRDKKLHYLCNKCRKDNEIQFAESGIIPRLPRSGIG